MMCATCHFQVDDDWTDTTGERLAGETDMLNDIAPNDFENLLQTMRLILRNLDGMGT